MFYSCISSKLALHDKISETQMSKLIAILIPLPIWGHKGRIWVESKQNIRS